MATRVVPAGWHGSRSAGEIVGGRGLPAHPIKLTRSSIARPRRLAWPGVRHRPSVAGARDDAPATGPRPRRYLYLPDRRIVGVIGLLAWIGLAWLLGVVLGIDPARLRLDPRPPSRSRP